MTITISPLPHHYTVQLADRRLLSPPRAPIAGGPPPQFGGSNEVWSPEELLVAATLECLWTTFEAYARRDKLVIDRIRGEAKGVLDKGPEGLQFTSITLYVDIQIAAGEVERARRILATAERHCIIANTLRVPVTVHATYNGSPVAVP